MSDNCPNYEVIILFPTDFKINTVNVSFIKKVIESVLTEGEWRPGAPDKRDPDYFYNGIPFEFTIASDSKKKNNFVQKFFSYIYSSGDIEQDVLSYILERIQDKASKQYSVEHVHLCVLCLLDLSNWVSDYYGSVTHDLIDYRRAQFFERIRAEYIASGRFNNIFILFPDPCACWWVYDVLSDNRAKYQLSDEEIRSGAFPFVMYKQFYDKFFSSEESK